MSFIDNFESRLRSKLKESLQYLIEYSKNPIHEIRRLPQWSPKHIFFVHLLLSIGSGFLSGLISFQIYPIFFGILFFPVISTVLTLILTSFFYYYFQVFEKRTVSFLRLATLVVFANLPFYLFHAGSSYVPPLTLLGLAFTGFLLIVGLTDNFSLEKKKSTKIVFALFMVIFLVWLWNKIDILKMDNF
jgi:hypothetical protein